jgi:3-oxoadipate enol-lactonase
VTAVALHSVVDGPAGSPPLLLGSSLGTTTELWRPQLPALTRRYRVVRYDHRGHGGSPVPPGSYGLDDLGSDVLALLDRQGIGRTHVAGVSLGGMVGMWLAAYAPERVDRLVLICTSASLGPPEMWADRARAVRTGGLSSIADTLIGRWFTDEVVRTRPDLVEEARAMLAAVPDAGYAGCCAAIETMDLTPVLGRITAPTLVVAGEDDQATPPAHARRIAVVVPGARLALVPGAAHLASMSHAEAVTGLMTQFLGGDDA